MTRQADIERLARFMGWPEGCSGRKGLEDGDIVFAMMVAEKIVAAGYSVHFNRYPKDRKWLFPPYPDAPAKEWTMQTRTDNADCTISRYEPDSDCWIVYVSALHEEMPYAIALAALAYLDAVGFK